MNFQVPQFIEVEDKIFGPLTFKQFLYVAGGLGISYLAWVYAPFRFLAVLIIAPVLLLAFSLAFYKVNNRAFVWLLEAAIRYFLGNKLYIWKKEKNKPKPAAVAAITPGRDGGINLPKLSQSRLKDLAWSLDVQEKVK